LDTLGNENNAMSLYVSSKHSEGLVLIVLVRPVADLRSADQKFAQVTDSVTEKLPKYDIDSCLHGP